MLIPVLRRKAKLKMMAVEILDRRPGIGSFDARASSTGKLLNFLQ